MTACNMLTKHTTQFCLIHAMLAGVLICVSSVPLFAVETPYFTFRGWETQVDGLWFDPPGQSTHWYKSERYLAYLDQLLAEAPKYDANALILMGRGDRCEVPTFISYRKWPLLNAVYEDRQREDRELQVRQLNRLIEKAARQGVGVYIWTHELQLPSELTQKYPQLAGKDFKFCPSRPELWDFVSSKYEEFFDRVPGLAGMFLVMSETQFSLLGGSPCHCDQCKSIKREELLEKLIRAVEAPLSKRGKRLIVRTHSHSHDDAVAICTAINRLPKDLQITVMSKATVMDFLGFHYPDEPMFTLIQDRPRFIEEVVGEYRGKTHIVCTPAEFYRERIQRAADNGVEGVALRIDHNGFPRSVFESPNLFNIYYISRLWVDPNIDAEAVWHEWFHERYGEQAARLLIPAFKNTESIWEQSTNTLGVYTVSAHGNLAPLFRGGYNAWCNISDSIFKITNGYLEWDALGAKLLHPSDETMARIEAEIAQANRLADESLEMVRKATPHLSSDDAEQLHHYFGVLRQSARMFGHLKMLFFLGLQAEQSKGQTRAAKIEKAMEQSRQAICLSWEIEREYGCGHWPLTPDDGRGSPFYQILTEYWSYSMTGLITQNKLRSDSQACKSAARLWGRILDMARPGENIIKQEYEFVPDDKLKSMAFAGDKIILTTIDRHTLTWPVAKPVTGPVLQSGGANKIVLQNTAEQVEVVGLPPTN